MANIGGVTSGNANSIYGNRNVISGLASGMDTEAMIKNSVSGIQSKISGLIQRQTKQAWKQEGYQSISDKLVQFTRKYTSYTSSTNLMGAGFFNSSSITSSSGANAGKVSATGKTGSSIQINGAAQLASATRYQLDSGGLLSEAGKGYIESGKSLDLNQETFTSNLSGVLALKYGDKAITLKMDETVYKTPEEFKAAIEDQLSKQNIAYDDGTTVKASDAIEVSLADGKLTFSDKKNAKNDVYITGFGGKLYQTMGKPTYDTDERVNVMDLNNKQLSTATIVRGEVLGSSISFNLDGVTKKITLPTAEELKAAGDDEAGLVRLINEKLTEAYGSGKLEASLESGKLRFTTKNTNSNLAVMAEKAEALGLRTQETTYLNTSRTLGNFLGEGADGSLNGLTGGTVLKGQGVTTKQPDGSYLDEKNNVVDKDGNRLGKDGKVLHGYDLTINGKKIGTYTRETAMDTVMLDINKNTQAGVKLSYSKTSNQFVFTANETGAGRTIDIDGPLGEALFGAKNSGTTTEGTDAIVNLTVNGSNMTLTRNSNTFEVDGLTMTVNQTFNGKMDAGKAAFDFIDASGNLDKTKIADPVGFTTKADVEKIVTAIKSMVEDYNTMVKEIRDAYSTVPAQKSNGGKYEPLTDSDLEGMSESAIKSYEEKAKQGILFGDSDLSAMYAKLTSAISPSGADGGALRAMGIDTKYSQGVTSISLDETALRKMLETDPEAVTDAFTKVAGDGSSTNGLMANMKKVMDTYAAVEGQKGVLINKAGSKYSPMSMLKNELKTKIEDFDSQIERWQTKLSDKVDYYTRQFTRLEQLVSEMNSQSSSLMGMMGGG